MWIEVKHTRIKIISGHWDKLLPEWWANRKQINSTATASEFAEKADEGDRAKGSKKGDKAKYVN